MIGENNYTRSSPQKIYRSQFSWKSSRTSVTNLQVLLLKTNETD